MARPTYRRLGVLYSKQFPDRPLDRGAQEHAYRGWFGSFPPYSSQIAIYHYYYYIIIITYSGWLSGVEGRESGRVEGMSREGGAGAGRRHDIQAKCFPRPLLQGIFDGGTDAREEAGEATHHDREQVSHDCTSWGTTDQWKASVSSPRFAGRVRSFR